MPDFSFPWGLLFVQSIHVCLGGLFVPEAYITATRQYVAQANSWSLEELSLEVNVTASQSATLDACSFGVTGEWESELSVWPFPKACFQMNVVQVAQLVLWMPREQGWVAVDCFSPVSTSPHRAETSRGHMQQQQAVALQCHLHSPPSNTATLGEANQR